MTGFIESTRDSEKAFFQNYLGQGEVFMLNMLRFKTKADYSDFKDLDPGVETSGQQAYELYMEHTLPILEQAGGSVVFYGSSDRFLIGPESEKWDAVLLVRHQSAQALISMSQDENYQMIKGHRTAAIEDSRLLPIKKQAQ